jgi:hypothetical protein
MLSTATDGLFRIANYAEAGLWTIVAAVFGVLAVKRPHPLRRRCIRAAAVFFLFGLSDIVEVHTGAWWRPWWLLIWKTSCVLAMMWLLWDHLRRRQAGS